MSISTLSDVLTLSEAADIWKVDPSIIHHAINNNRFFDEEIRKSGSTWLISYDAMIRLFGESDIDGYIKNDIYTIGYEGRTVEQFLSVLKDYKIDAILDVRANPISRKKGFSKTPLTEHLRQNGIEYMPFSTLGTPKELRNELSENGDYKTFFDKYNSWLNRQMFKFQGLQLEVSGNLSKRYCLMCFERNPNECHRSVIAKNLLSKVDEITEVINI